VAALGALLRESRDLLGAAGAEDAALDARLIVEHFTGTSRTDALARPEQDIPALAVEAVRAALTRRLAGEPVHRILGRRAFYGLDLELSPATLEPRPDTEVLVDRLVPRLAELVRRHGTCRVLDLGTGTGAIALALLAQVPEATAIGVDVDRRAVETAARNAAANGLSERFEGRVSDWFSNVNGKFHAIVSNPPYIETKDMAELSPEVRLFDPPGALDGGADGLDAYRAIAAGAARFLEPDGLIGVEIGHMQRETVTAVFTALGFARTEAAKDLAGRDRVLIFEPGSPMVSP
jgi:release factor glutamine methyltransferase